ncbi:MAG: hypothetical protein RQ826_13765 [Xanthomonadales bacterium]|nr:hypothetical protein [Xanthomonadales bacterium]
MNMKRLIALTAMCLCICTGAALAGTKPVAATELEGAWELVSYQLPDSSPEVSGLMLIKDGHFAISYDMLAPGGTASARSHAGTYRFEAEKLVFDVKWWVEIVDGVARIVEPQLNPTDFEFAEPNLRLMFTSGSVQHWRRIQP